MMRKFTVEVRRTVVVTLDETKFTPEFFDEFNSTIVDKGGNDGDFERAIAAHAEHLAWVHASGLEDLSDAVTPAFVEGYGPITDMGINAVVTEDDTDIVETTDE